MAGYDGLALSLYDKNAISFTDDGPHNFFSITITDATTVTTGYIQPFYTSVTLETGSAISDQVNCFAADFAIGGTPAAEMSGMYLYFSEKGTATVTNLQLNGVAVYFGAFGAAMANRVGFHAYSEESSTYTTGDIDAAFYAYGSGADGTWRALLGSGGSTAPEYFFENTTALGGAHRMIRVIGSDAAGTAQVAAQMRVLIDTTEYFIPLYPTTCS